jgi:N-acetylmuramoyl-L-alanine amidase
MVQGITISATGQLAIQLDRPASYRLLLQGNTYILDIGSAAIAEEFVRPTLTYDSPIQRIRLDEFGDVVRITIQLDDHWQLREGARVSHQINLQLFPPDTATVLPIPVIPHRGKGLVVIDPGHGGRDPGAVDNGVQEKDLVLPISLRLGRLLQSMGYTVQYTRTTDVELELEPRVLFANRLQADVFISIHANSLASRNSSISGVETYYALGSTWGFTLATLVHQQVLLATGARDRGVRAARFYVVRHTTMPAILLETGFVTNPTEAANLSNPSYQERMARGVAQGIDQFFRTYQPIGRRN